MPRLRTLVPRLLGALLCAWTAACAVLETHAVTDRYDADGPFLRHVRLRVAPAHTQDFEALMARLVAAAESAELTDDWHWLCYLESPGRYWIVTSSETRDGFPVPRSQRPLRAFARAVVDQASLAARTDVVRRLATLEYEIEWVLEARGKAAWSNAKVMSTAEQPKARLMVRTVRPGQEAAFERALAERVDFLVAHDYPLPIEGFVTLSGAPGTALQVVFARDWPSFHERESFWQFVQHLPEAARDAYMQRKAALMRTMASAEYYHGDFRAGASHASAP